MPHFGHAPGVFCRTSGSIGQMYCVPTGADAGAFAGAGTVEGAAPPCSAPRDFTMVSGAADEW